MKESGPYVFICILPIYYSCRNCIYSFTNIRLRLTYINTLYSKYCLYAAITYYTTITLHMYYVYCVRKSITIFNSLSVS